MRLLSLITVLPLLVAGNLVSDELVGKLDGLRKMFGVPGIGISVVSGDQTQLITLGNATATTPITETTRFAIGSCSKAFTTYALSRLMADPSVKVNGKPVTWTTTLADILGNEWLLPDPYATKNMNLLDLAAQKSGMPGHDTVMQDIPARDLVRKLRWLPMQTFRSGYNYNNNGYITLQRVVEVLSGKAFPDYMNEVFDSWGMHGVDYNLQTAVTKNMATGHYHTRDPYACIKSVWPNLDPACVGQVNPLERWTNGTALGISGAGGATVPLNEIQHFQRWVLKNPLDWPQIATGARDPFSSDQVYGLGLISYNYQTARLIGHSGSMPGQDSQILHCPDRRVSVAVFVTDTEWSQMRLATVYSVLEEVLGLQKNDWTRMMFDRVTQRPIPPTPEGRGAPVLGRYCSKAYGRLEFKPAEDRVVKNLPPGVPRNSATHAPLDNTILSHSMVLSPVNAPFYNWTLVMDRFDPPLVGASATVGTAIVMDKGFGMFGLSSTGQYNPVVVDGVEKAADMWFEKC